MTSEAGRVTPRVLIRVTLFDPDGSGVRRRAYEARQPDGILRVSEHVRESALGYAEFEPYAQVPRHHDREAFRALVDEKARYVHWIEGRDVDE